MLHGFFCSVPRLPKVETLGQMQLVTGLVVPLFANGLLVGFELDYFGTKINSTT